MIKYVICAGGSFEFHCILAKGHHQQIPPQTPPDSHQEGLSILVSGELYVA